MEQKINYGKRRKKNLARCSVKRFISLWEKHSHSSPLTNLIVSRTVKWSRSHPFSPATHQLVYLAFTLILLQEACVALIFGTLRSFVAAVMVIPMSGVMFAKAFLKGVL